MKTAIGLLVLAVMFLVAEAAFAQLVVPSYERKQKFPFCDTIPQGDELSVPFDFINKGKTQIILDSAIATGDTTDFYSNVTPTASGHYLNPVMWRFINGEAIEPGDVFFNSFFFLPHSTGDKQLSVTVYYHDSAGSGSTQMSVLFHTTYAPAGLALLRSSIDTIAYNDTIGYKSVTYDRSVVRDAVYSDTVYWGGTLRAAVEGEKRVDLTTCGDETLIRADLTMDTPGDSFQVFLPSMPFTLVSGDSLMLDYIYIARSIEIPHRTAMVTFTTSDSVKATFTLDLVTPKPAGVTVDHGVTGGVNIALAGAPNPFRETATLRLAVPRAGHARLSIADGLGQEVAVLADGLLEAGPHEYRVDGAGMPAGAYYVRCEMEGQVRTYRLMLVR